jgi:hypothetical protein
MTEFEHICTGCGDEVVNGLLTVKFHDLLMDTVTTEHLCGECIHELAGESNYRISKAD